jgi:hypothetical protein|tara:strand:+ start:215 stop:415 length:201 start_codon:yes stop_codon:yes gene_type:complete
MIVKQYLDLKTDQILEETPISLFPANKDSEIEEALMLDLTTAEIAAEADTVIKRTICNSKSKTTGT